MKDGKPFQYVSGSFHYYRALKENWKDIMIKMRGAGLNALQTYIEWSSHEAEPGIYNFEGNLDLITFLKTAQEVGLLVVLRPGPYICAERENGGLPYWLLSKKPNIHLRTSDPVYIEYIDKWFGVLMPMLEPLLYRNGGPIILVQVENEYGASYCDKAYMSHLRDLNWKYLGKDVILFRTDDPEVRYFTCDQVEGLMVTGDCEPGRDMKTVFSVMEKFNPTQPNVITEYYTGWMDHWGYKHTTRATDIITKTLDEILHANGSASFYMFYGGTNFGFTNGADYSLGSVGAPQVTTYDYDAPINEAGDVTDKLFKIREVIGKYLPLPPAPSPLPSPKLSLGPLNMNFESTLLDSLKSLNGPSSTISKYPIPFELVGLNKGFMAYSTRITFRPRDPEVLQAPGIKDRGYIFINNKLRGILSHFDKAISIPIQAQQGDNLTIVAENQGRLNNGVTDLKGLISNVTLGSKILQNWVMTPIPLNDTHTIHKLRSNSSNPLVFQPAFYTTRFVLLKDVEPANTFLDPTGWHRGVAFINGFNLGRYWPIMGPQVTLFVPKQLIKPFPQENVLTVLELEGNSCTEVEGSLCTMKFVPTSNIDGPVPN